MSHQQQSRKESVFLCTCRVPVPASPPLSQLQDPTGEDAAVLRLQLAPGLRVLGGTRCPFLHLLKAATSLLSKYSSRSCSAWTTRMETLSEASSFITWRTCRQILHQYCLFIVHGCGPGKYFPRGPALVGTVGKCLQSSNNPAESNKGFLKSMPAL